MTTFVEAPASAASNGPGTGRRRTRRDGLTAFAGACSLVVLNTLHPGPGWAHWAALLTAVAAALAVLVAGALGWEQTVATAEAAGLVARSRRMAAGIAPKS